MQLLYVAVPSSKFLLVDKCSEAPYRTYADCKYSRFHPVATNAELRLLEFEVEFPTFIFSALLYHIYFVDIVIFCCTGDITSYAAVHTLLIAVCKDSYVVYSC